MAAQGGSEQPPPAASMATMQTVLKSILVEVQATRKRADETWKEAQETRKEAQEARKEAQEARKRAEETHELQLEVARQTSFLYRVRFSIHLPCAMLGFRARVYKVLEDKGAMVLKIRKPVVVSCESKPLPSFDMAPLPPVAPPSPTAASPGVSPSEPAVTPPFMGGPTLDLSDPYRINGEVFVQGLVEVTALKRALADLLDAEGYREAFFVDPNAAFSKDVVAPTDSSFEDKLALMKHDDLGSPPTSQDLGFVRASQYVTMENPLSRDFVIAGSVSSFSASSASTVVDLWFRKYLEVVQRAPCLVHRDEPEAVNAHLVARADLTASDRGWLNDLAANFMALPSEIHDLFDGRNSGRSGKRKNGDPNDHPGVIAFAVSHTDGAEPAPSLSEGEYQRVFLRVYIRGAEYEQRVRFYFTNGRGLHILRDAMQFDTDLELHYFECLWPLYLAKHPIRHDPECPDHRPEYWLACGAHDDVVPYAGLGPEAGEKAEDAVEAPAVEASATDETTDIATAVGIIQKSQPKPKPGNPSPARVRRYHHVFQDCMRESFLRRIAGWNADSPLQKEFQALREKWNLGPNKRRRKGKGGEENGGGEAGAVGDG
eukprot:CAMPEP_0118968822 /NCGR_PEP_ID=MMETSP1173-20130426/5999_1 /TAXON_ID=1034831 /ORGANISM="Rhizochromulina marina cf, Strain CCMP1243" /LENGTH=600 /DNA_ID=CAMNT_0006917995 /DNA_START=22 /DNA_END=1824 /DNA_ORIENTATION=+